ncbi:trna-splicing endonuclease subunit sen34 [Stemphylium lycopersici]|uniref:tRNA-intron lyase n=1 Tax=Stemphylium lycopersici TaxID=183478 RepID=A0A364N1Y6_STELY|nr:trna-splicing endonuclease subunit sen34 [Stemphylium lycopersici]
MAQAPAPNPIKEPFPISLVGGRYLLFDVDVIAHCRRAHNICGLLVGTIPNLSQQNVFLGVPLELMPEEARVLVDKGAAYIVDDAQAHQERFAEMSREERLKYMAEMDKRGEEVTREQTEMAERRKERALREKGLKTDPGSLTASSTSEQTLHASDSGLGFIMKGSRFSDSSTPIKVAKVDASLSPSTASSDAGSSGLGSSGLGFIMKGSSFSDSWVQVKPPKIDSPALVPIPTAAPPAPVEESLFDAAPAAAAATAAAPSIKSSAAKGVAAQKHYVTPTTSYPPTAAPPKERSAPPPKVPDSYPLFRYLHSKGYYHMPGLRFGCHYNVYPGDPLRYHSHFAATGLGWDQKFELLDVVGGGRLGTGTKKAYMIGGEDPDVDAKEKDPVRAFSVEWAAL